MTKTPKPFGWEVTVAFQRASGKPNKTFHYRGCTERRARMNGILKANASEIVAIEPVYSQEAWERAEGIPQRM